MKRYCRYCNKEVCLKEERRIETYPVKGEKTEIEATIYVCEECEHEVWLPDVEDENLEKAYELYRKRHGLLMPQEIQAIREKYGLSQTAFSKILGFGEKTITRYENGSLQDEAPNNLLLLVQNPDCFMELYRHNKHKLSQADIRRVEEKRMTFTLPNAMKYRIGLRRLGSEVYSFNQEGISEDFPIEQEEEVV